MSGIIVTPQIVRRIEDNLRYILVSAWARRESNLWWRRVAKTRSSSTKRELLQMVWDFRSPGRTRTLDSHASRLRQKLVRHSDAGWIANVWGVGYRLCRPE